MPEPKPSKKLTRRRFLQVASLGAAVVATDAFLIEPKRVVVTRNELPINFDGSSGTIVRFVQLTDLHLQDDVKRMKQITSVVNELKPDFIAFTGDSIDRADGIGDLGEFLDLLNPATPKFATLGNWEYWGNVNFSELKKAYAARNTRLLINETADFVWHGQRALITGLDTDQGGFPNLSTALDGIKPCSNHIVLAHCPIQREQISAAITESKGQQGRSDLSGFTIQCVLSGHTHGGQVTVLGVAPFCPPGSGRYVKGWYSDTSPPLYVSRGLGNSIFPARFCATPEIACFDWALENASVERIS